MSLLAPSKTVEKLQMTRHAKAKESPGYRFFSLYDKVYRADVLLLAYRRCRANDGAPGVDGQTFADIDSYGWVRWLGELAQDWKGKTYLPQAVRRVWIPKADGAKRPLGIPTIRDRVVQMAAVLVLEPIFETDLPPEPYAYRAGRSALDAVRAVPGHLDRGNTEVVDADLSGYFDSIPHAERMKSVARRVSDSSLLHLVKMGLDCCHGLVKMLLDRRSKRPTSEAWCIERRGTRTRVAARRRGEFCLRCWRICTCVGSCLAGRIWSHRDVWALAS